MNGVSIFFIAHLLIISCHAVTIVAHRGASGYEPENTLRSFSRALTLHAPMIELDVYRAKSGEVIVMHDETVDRTTNGSGKVENLSWTDLQSLDAGKGEHIPLLTEVLDLVHKRIMVNIELKSKSALQPVVCIIQDYVVNHGWRYDQFMVSSFDHYVVKEAKDSLPCIKTGVLFEGNPIGLAQIATRAGADYAVTYYESLTDEFIQDAHKRGIKVFVYTVNTKTLAEELIQRGVDGIITNYPDILSLNGSK